MTWSFLKKKCFEKVFVMASKTDPKKHGKHMFEFTLEFDFCLENVELNFRSGPRTFQTFSKLHFCDCFGDL